MILYLAFGLWCVAFLIIVAAIVALTPPSKKMTLAAFIIGVVVGVALGVFLALDDSEPADGE